MGMGSWMALGIILLTLMLVFTGGPESCPEDLKVCPDGSYVARNQSLGCEFPECPNIGLIHYCTEGVSVVESADDLVKVNFDDGFILYGTNVASCLDLNPECIGLAHMVWSESINCADLEYLDPYACPTDYNEIGDQKYVSCEAPIEAKFQEYCEDSYKQWIAYNCPEINILS